MNLINAKLIVVNELIISKVKEKLEVHFKETGKTLIIEYLFKFADFDDIKQGFKLFGKRVMKQVSKDKLKSGKMFIKLNFIIAIVFLGMDIKANYLKRVKNARFEKLKMLVA